MQSKNDDGADEGSGQSQSMERNLAAESFPHMAPVEEGDESDSELSQLTETKLISSPVLRRGSKQVEEMRSSNNNSPTDFLSTSQASLGSLSSSTRLHLGELKPPSRLQHKPLSSGPAEMHAAPALRPVHAPHSLGPASSPKASLGQKSLSSPTVGPGPVVNPRHHSKFSPLKDDAQSLSGMPHLSPHAPLGEIKQHNRLDVPPLGEIKHFSKHDSHTHSPDAKEPKSARSLTDASPMNSARTLGALHTQHSPLGQHNSIPSPKLSPVAQLRKAVTEVAISMDEKEVHEEETPSASGTIPAQEPVQSADGVVEDRAPPSSTKDSPEKPSAQADVEVLMSSQNLEELSPRNDVELPRNSPDHDTNVYEPADTKQSDQTDSINEVVEFHAAEKRGDNSMNEEPARFVLSEPVSASQESPLPAPRPATPPSPPRTAEPTEDATLLQRAPLIPPHTPVRGVLGSGSKSSRFNRIHQSGGHSPPPLQTQLDIEPEEQPEPEEEPEPVPQSMPVPVEESRIGSQPPPLPISEVVNVSATSKQSSPRSSPRSASSSQQVSPRQGSPRLPSPRGQGSAATAGQTPHTPHALFKKNSQSNMSVAGTVNTERSFGTLNRSVHSVAQASNSYEASYNKAASDLRAALMRLDSDVAGSKTMVRNIFRKFDVDEHGELTAKELKSFVLSPELGLFNSDDPRALKFATMLMEQIDINGDGSVSLSELENFLWPRATVTSSVENTPGPSSTIPLMFQSPWERQHAPKPSELKEIGIVIDFTRTAVRNHVSSVAALGSDEAILQEFAKFAKATLKRGMLDTRLVKKAFLNIKINEFGRCLYQEEVDQLVASIDCNDDGVVSAQEFKHWLFPAHKQEEHDHLTVYLKKYLDEVFGGDVWQMFRALCNGSDVCYKPDFVLVLKALDKNISKQEALAIANKISSEKAITMAHFAQALNISARNLAADGASVNVSHSGSMDAESAAFGTPRTRRRRRRNTDQGSRLSTLNEEGSPIEGALFPDGEDGEGALGGRRKAGPQSESLLPDENGVGAEDSDVEMSDDASELSFDSALDDNPPGQYFPTSTAPGSGGKRLLDEPVVEVDPTKLPSERELQRVREILYGERGRALQANLAATNASFASQISELEQELPEGIEPVRRTVGLTPSQLTAIGYSGHAGRWRGHPYDTWSCCDTADLKCPLGDGSAFSPTANSPSKIRTSLDSSTGSLFYKSKSVPFVPAGRSPAKSSQGINDLRPSTPPPVTVRHRSTSQHKPAEKPVRTKPSPAQARLAAKAEAKKLAPPSPRKALPVPEFNQELHIAPSKLQVRPSKAQPVRVPPRIAPVPRKLSTAPKAAPAPPAAIAAPKKPTTAAVGVSKANKAREPVPRSQVNVPPPSAPYVPSKSAPITANFVVNVPRSVSPPIPPDDAELFQHLYAPSPIVQAQKVELKPRNADPPSAVSPSSSPSVRASATKALEVFKQGFQVDACPPSPAYSNTLRSLREELNETRTSTYLDDFEFSSELREEEPKLRIHAELLKQIEEQEAASEQKQSDEVKSNEGETMDSVQEAQPPVPASPHHAFHEEWTRHQARDVEETKQPETRTQELDATTKDTQDLAVTGASLQFASRLYYNLQSGDDYDTAELRAKYGEPLLIGSVDDPYLPGEAHLPNKYFKAPPERKKTPQRSLSAPPTRSPRVPSSNHDSFFAARPVPPRAVVRQELGAKRPEEVKHVNNVSVVPPTHHDGVWLPTSPLHGVSFYRNNRRRRSKRDRSASPLRARSASPAVSRRGCLCPPGPRTAPSKERVVVNGELKSIHSQPAARIYPSTPSSAGLHGHDVSSISHDQTLFASSLPRNTQSDRIKALFDPPSSAYQPIHRTQAAGSSLPAHLQFPPGYAEPLAVAPPVYQAPPAPYVFTGAPSPAYSMPHNPVPAYSSYPMPYNPYGNASYMPYTAPSAYGMHSAASMYPSSVVPNGLSGPHAIDTWWDQIRAQKRQHEIQGYESVQSRFSTNKM